MQSETPTTPTMHTECDDDCFVHRVHALPLVRAASDYVVGTYDGVKTNGPETVKTGIATVEAYVHDVTTKVAPFYEKYLFTLVCLVSKMACMGLNVVERYVPAVKSTPRDVNNAVYSIYDGSRLQSGVQYAQGVKGSAVNKVNGAGKMGADVLDTLNKWCNRYIAVPEEAVTKPWFPPATSMRERVVILCGKTYRGLVYQAGNAIDYVMSFYSSAKARALSARVYVLDIYETAKSYALYAIALPSTLTLRCARSVTALLAELSTRAVGVTPASLKPAVQSTNDVIVNANVNVQEADSVSELAYDAFNGASNAWSTAVDKYPVLGKIYNNNKADVVVKPGKHSVKYDKKLK